MKILTLALLVALACLVYLLSDKQVRDMIKMLLWIVVYLAGFILASLALLALVVYILPVVAMVAATVIFLVKGSLVIGSIVFVMCCL